MFGFYGSSTSLLLFSLSPLTSTLFPAPADSCFLTNKNSSDKPTRHRSSNIKQKADCVSDTLVNKVEQRAAKTSNVSSRSRWKPGNRSEEGKYWLHRAENKIWTLCWFCSASARHGKCPTNWHYFVSRIWLMPSNDYLYVIHIVSVALSFKLVGPSE